MKLNKWINTSLSVTDRHTVVSVPAVLTQSGFYPWVEGFLATLFPSDDSIFMSSDCDFSYLHTNVCFTLMTANSHVKTLSLSLSHVFIFKSLQTMWAVPLGRKNTNEISLMSRLILIDSNKIKRKANGDSRLSRLLLVFLLRDLNVSNSLPLNSNSNTAHQILMYVNSWHYKVSTNTKSKLPSSVTQVWSERMNSGVQHDPMKTSDW